MLRKAIGSRRLAARSIYQPNQEKAYEKIGKSRLAGRKSRSASLQTKSIVLLV
jgi:hypothetical protein